MRKIIMLPVLLIGVMGSPSARSFAQPAQVPPRCLHGASEQPNERTRREQALKMAEDINRAEHTGPTVMIPGRRRTYRPFDQLPGVPPTPAGFRVQLETDTATYAFSLKDMLDACHYGIFSDQDSWIYEATPRTGIQLRPVETY
jgi:hypothetical protein